MVSVLPPLLENAILRFTASAGWVPDAESGLPIPIVGKTIEVVAFIKPAVGALGGQKLRQFVKPGADSRGEELECYLIRPMELPPELFYQDGGTIERFDSPSTGSGQRAQRELGGLRYGKILEIKPDTRLPLVTSIVGRHLYLSVEWSNHGAA